MELSLGPFVLCYKLGRVRIGVDEHARVLFIEV